MQDYDKDYDKDCKEHCDDCHEKHCEEHCEKHCEEHCEKHCECEKRPDKHCEKKQTHVHEFLGSTQLAECCEDKHNHRFAGVSGQAIYLPSGHFHEIEARTDFFDHFHLIKAKTSLQIPVGEGKHVHFIEAFTNEVDEHCHELEFATLIEAPLIDRDRP